MVVFLTQPQPAIHRDSTYITWNETKLEALEIGLDTVTQRARSVGTGLFLENADEPEEPTPKGIPS
jgi:hypothetical protein